MKKLSFENILILFGSGIIALGIILPIFNTGLVYPNQESYNGISFFSNVIKHGHSDSVFLGIIVLIYSLCSINAVVLAGIHKTKLSIIFATSSWVLFFITILVISSVDIKISLPNRDNLDEKLIATITSGGIFFLVFIGQFVAFLGTLISFYKSAKASSKFLEESAFIIGLIVVGGGFISFLPCLKVMSWMLIPLSITGIIIGFIPASKSQNFQTRASAGFILSLCGIGLSIASIILSECLK